MVKERRQDRFTEVPSFLYTFTLRKLISPTWGFYLTLSVDTQTSTTACLWSPTKALEQNVIRCRKWRHGGVNVINFLGDLAPKPQSLFLSFSIRSKDLPLTACGSAAGVSSLICSPVLSLTCPCNLTAGRLALHLLSVSDFSFGDNRKEPNISQD